MARAVEVFQVDAFTKRRFAGNPAGVVLGADVLSDAEMLAIARELNNADTAFVLAAEGSDHDLRIRFFTPRTEAAFVGHATLAAHAVLARREPQAMRRQLGRTGVVEVSQHSPTAFSMRVPPTPPGRAMDAALLPEVLAALGVPRGALDERAPPRIAGTGSTRLLLAVQDGALLATLEPDLARLKALSAQDGAAGYFVYSLHPAQEGCDVESRMFCPALGIPEDPVSGNAHGMLACHLLACGAVAPDADVLRLTGVQGHHLGRPGRVGVEVRLDPADARRAAEVHVSGETAFVFATRIELD